MPGPRSTAIFTLSATSSTRSPPTAIRSTSCTVSRRTEFRPAAVRCSSSPSTRPGAIRSLLMHSAGRTPELWACSQRVRRGRNRRGTQMTTGDQPPPEAAASPRSQSRWSTGRLIGMVFSSIGGLIGLALLLGGIAVIVAYAFGRDDDGYFNTDRKQLESSTYAVTTEQIDLGADELDWAPEGILGNVRVQVDSAKPVFVGIGSDDDVDRYLSGVNHDELIDFGGGTPDYDLHAGGAPRTRPGGQTFWVAQSEGTGEQALTWDAEFGRWTAVVMNADAARGIDVEADAGVKLNWAIWAGLALLVVGLVMTVGAVVVILLISRGAATG